MYPAPVRCSWKVQEYFMATEGVLLQLGRVVLLILLLLVLIPFIEAQVSMPEEEEQPTQLLGWSGGEYAFSYEVIIEKEKDGTYQGVVREFTDKTFFEATLPLGYYRYQVIPYDYLGQPGQESEWAYFEVRPNPVPEPKPEPVKYQKQLNVYVNAAWLPLLPVYGEGFGESLAIPSAAVRIGIVSDGSLVNVGPELTAGWYTVGKQHMITGELNLVSQILFPNNAIALCFRIGAGLFLPIGEEGIPFPDSMLDAFYTNIGLSVRLVLWKHMYLEAGIDYAHLFTEIASGAIRPWIGVGIQL